MSGWIINLGFAHGLWQVVVCESNPVQPTEAGKLVALYLAPTVAEALAKVIALNLASEPPVSLSIWHAIGPTDEPVGL